MVRFVLAFMTVATVAWCVRAQQPAVAPVEGRFLYADDDDWDWATPEGANKPSGLAVYGKMPWSALDWMEEGLPEVRGVLIGTPPVIGNYLTMAALNEIRGAGPRRSYEHIPHTPNIISEMLKEKKAPNLIILMQDNGTEKPPVITDSDREAAVDFVRRGGRLIILDDWTRYRLLVEPFVDARRFGPKPEPVARPDAKLKKSVEEHVGLLGSDDFRTREKASNELVLMGKTIVPMLEEIKAPSLEVQRRIEAILKVLAPPLPRPATQDGWLADITQRAGKLHQHSEAKAISRNGDMTRGTALCIRILPAKK